MKMNLEITFDQLEFLNVAVGSLLSGIEKGDIPTSAGDLPHIISVEELHKKIKELMEDCVAQLNSKKEGTTEPINKVEYPH